MPRPLPLGAPPRESMADHFRQATFAVETHRVSVDQLAIERGENEGMLPRDLNKAL
ncbi:MAG: hypothetical protein WBN44_09505 [Woeseiaceae bacterium]